MEISDSNYKDIEKQLSYGTAGFRTLGSLLDRACFRVGILVAIRAKITGRCGIMITASHNDWCDNGVKIIEHDGSMLVTHWEKLAEHFVNTPNIMETCENFNEIKIKGYLLGVNIFS